MKGVLYFSNGLIEEPFQAWYDEKSGRSRIDYYGGIVSTYQFRDAGESGKLYRFIPITTFESTNTRTCYEIDGNGKATDGENTENSDTSDSTDTNDNNNNYEDSNNQIEQSTDDVEITNSTDAVSLDEGTDTSKKTKRKKRSDDNENNEDDNENKTKTKRIKPQSVLPDCGDFKYAGK